MFQAFQAFFFKQYKWKKVVVGAGTKQNCGSSKATTTTPIFESESLKQEFELDGGKELSADEWERALTLGEDEAPVDCYVSPLYCSGLPNYRL